LELDATYKTEKSFPRKDAIRHADANVTNANSVYAAGRPIAIKSARPRVAPTKGKTPAINATPNANQSKK
jgi:hypothetical protein